MPEEELYSWARKAHAAGWQIGTHANGDVGIDIALRVYERLQREMPRRDPRFRLEHCTVINDSLIRRIKALGAIPTPFSTYVYYHGEKMREYGAERLNSMFALRSFLDAGIRATQASDYPPGPFEPMMALQSEVTRTDTKGNVWGPTQKVTIDEALRIGTLHGAYASFEEGSKGSIEPGKLADLVVLGRDPKKEASLHAGHHTHRTHDGRRRVGVRAEVLPKPCGRIARAVDCRSRIIHAAAVLGAARAGLLVRLRLHALARRAAAFRQILIEQRRQALHDLRMLLVQIIRLAKIFDDVVQLTRR